MDITSSITRRVFARIPLVLCILAGFSATVAAQDFDDIYYNPSKDKAKEKAKIQASTAKRNPDATIEKVYNPSTYTPTPDYTAAGSYEFNTGSTRDVDEYNRRTSSNSVSNASDTTQAQSDDFEYTRRIERFHNPDIVVNTDDPNLIEYYYNTEPASPSVVNIYIDNDPWWGWNRPYCSTWAWTPFYYNYNTWWGPYWSLGWYDPWYSWSWGPSWGWGPSYGWGWGGTWYPGYYPPYPGGWNNGWAGTWHPTPSSPGASRPHQWVGNGSTNTRPNTANTGSSRPSTITRPGYNPGSLSGTNASAARPGSSLRGRYPSASTSNSASDNSSRWPASVNTGSAGGTRPSGTTVNTTRGRNTYTPSSSSSNTQRRNTSNNYNNNNSYNNTHSSSSSGFSNGGSYRSSGGSSGGYRSSGSGSGGTRGRR